MENLKTFTETQIQELTAAGRYRTARAYQSAFNKLSTFLGREADFGDICYDAMKGFELWMQAGCLALNTTSFYVRNIRAIYNKGAKAGVFVADSTVNPFSGVFTGVAKTAKRALEEVEIHKMVEAVGEELKDFKNGKVCKDCKDKKVVNDNRNCKDKKKSKTGFENREEKNALLLFLFCFFAQGMPFADAVLLKKTAVVGDAALVYRRRKTGKEVIVFLTEPMRRIMDCFAAETHDSPYVFPFVKDVKDGRDEYRKYTVALTNQNRRLKAVCRTAGLEKPVSTHVARHSWASAAYNNNIPVSTISASLGHCSEKTTQIYLDMMNSGAVAQANYAISNIFYNEKLKK
ncbi:MAG: site-specific integrase [Dysgonamonadaceae bacterium]|jgi:integrase|nr:site-specific integrase [Dysgonamonadaceae bacterium]